MRIEDLIKSRKDRLDLEEVPLESWNQIKNEWKKEDTKSSFKIWKAAAIVFVTTSAVLLIYSLSLRNQVNQLASLGDISQEYQVVEEEYQSQISILEAGISFTELNENEDLKWMMEELKILEEINQVYRADIGKVANQEQLVNALIDYYEKKINLLKKLELEINRTKNFKENEKDHSTTIGA